MIPIFLLRGLKFFMILLDITCNKEQMQGILQMHGLSVNRDELWIAFYKVVDCNHNLWQGVIIMKVQIYSQWMEDVYIPVRVKQFTKAAKLMGHDGFKAYAESHDVVDLHHADRKSDERQVVAEWLDNRENDNVATGVA